MRVGWLADPAVVAGGAELTQAEFRAAAPDDVEILDCPPGIIYDSCDRFVIHNCVQYTTELLGVIRDRPVFKYWHDVGPHVHPDVRAWLDKRATPICCSPLQAEHMGIDAKLIPPPVALGRFRAASEASSGRAGAVCVGSWANPGKAPWRAAEWAAGNGGIDFYGGGAFAPAESMPVDYDEMPTLLASYKTFVFLPVVLEPFGRLVVEAWASGCEIVTNRLVGARWWIENAPERLETAAEDFWRLVLS